MTRTISKLDRALATVCEYCPVCVTARKSQSGVIHNFVKFAETKFCPFCRAYGRVHGHPAHLPDTR
ncbi:MAG TPA: hypothetical protein PLW81_08040 [Thiobacillaceae bacterium]|nr:hypothetical protein [Thiobacillaceae bacterium]